MFNFFKKSSPNKYMGLSAQVDPQIQIQVLSKKKIYNPDNDTWAYADGSGLETRELRELKKTALNCLGYPSLFGILLASSIQEDFNKNNPPLSDI